MDSQLHPPIQPMQAHQEPRVVQTLSRAFFNDGLLIILQPDEEKRHDFGVWFWSRAIAYTRKWGQVFSREDGAGAALWLPPGNTGMTMDRVIRAGFLGLPLHAGLQGTARFLRLMPTIEKIHKASVSGPHWHLFGIGVEPELHGQGIGSALMDVGLVQVDAGGHPCYLETGNESNVAFYSRRGFEVTGETSFYGFTVWGMVRMPNR